MPQKIRMWEITSDNTPTEITSSGINLEERLEHWLENDISMLDPDLLVIGRQVRTEFGGYVDLLCLDSAGALVVVELKAGRTPREVAAQALDYASWAKGLSSDEIRDIAKRYSKLRGSLEEVFQNKFGEPLHDSPNQDHRSLIVAEAMDESTERIVRYLSDMGVPINVATVQYFKSTDGREMLAQVFLVEPELAVSKALSGYKRGYNRTLAEIQEMAVDAGVWDLYACMGEKSRGFMPRGAIGSSVVYRVSLYGSLLTAIIVSPSNSSATDGLSFAVSGSRLMKRFNLNQEQLIAILPSSTTENVNARPWSGALPEEHESWQQFSGRFRTVEEVDTFMDGLKEQEQ